MTGVIPRAEAKAQGLKRYFTGKPCPNGHLLERHVSSGGCVECARAYAAAWYARDGTLARARSLKYYAANREACMAVKRSWYAANSDKVRANVAAWCAANPDKKLALYAKRRALKISAIPSDWSEFDAFVIEEAATACKRRESMTGYAWHVDHMVPLAKGGMHCASNIQVIPARMNLAKSAKLILTTPFEWVALLPGAAQ
ncbi:HNH endonuclease [Xanthomonas phage M29]|nr:HNH endonuclease [Xanthomonas phage M29]